MKVKQEKRAEEQEIWKKSSNILAAKGQERVNKFTQNAIQLHTNEYFACLSLYCIAVRMNPKFLNATYIIISELKTN